MSVIRNVVQVHAQPDSNTLELIMDDARTIDIKVDLLKIALDDVHSLVYLYDASESNVARGEFVFEPNFYVLDFNNITDPLEANADDLYSSVLGLISESSAVTVALNGVSTEKKQDVQIEKITNGNTTPSVFKDNALQSAFVPALGNAYLKDITDFSAFILNAVNQINNFVTLGTFYIKNTFSIVRPANATVYTIGDAINDVVPTVFELVGVAQSISTITLHSITVFDSNNAVVKPIFSYAFFKSAPPVIVDNTPVSITDLFASTEFIGAVSVADFSASLNPTALAGGNSIQTKNIIGGLPLETAGTSIWVVPYLANAYTPIPSENFVFTFTTKFFN